MQNLIKSPLNYVGNKYRVLPELLQIFPDNINQFVDLCAGGGDVAWNINANSILANDINSSVISILKEFHDKSSNEVLDFIDMRIDEFKLDKTNEEGFLKYRELYNTDAAYHTPLDLFTITRFSFNQLIRFNNKMELNSAFGRNRSSFNTNLRNNTIAFCNKVNNIEFTSQDYKLIDLSKYTEKDFIYIDPPYLISNADYNTGKTAKLSWKQQDDINLQSYLDEANAIGLRWATSNFIKHKGNVNQQLEDWALNNNYNIHVLHSDYTSLTTKAARVDDPTLEVVITNYTK